MKIFFIAGEASGDVIGANLITALKQGGDVECVGIGGHLMIEAGLESLLPMDQISVMGIWEVVPRLPHLFKIYKGILAEIEKRQPDAVVTIDFQDFNMHVMRALKTRAKSKAKRVQYVAPTVWAWRPGRAKIISAFLDGLICLFPFEPQYFKKHGLKTVVAGHPLTEENVAAGNGKAFRETNEIPPGAKTLGLFFGSRDREIKAMSGVLKETALLLKETYPDLYVIVPTLPHLEFDVVGVLQGFNCPVSVVSKPENKWDSFAACDVAVAVSGTVGLELAYAGIPHVIAYKMNPSTWAMVKALAKVKHAHLANIILKREVVPEFLQKNCESVKISEGVQKLIESPEQQAFQKKGFAKLRELIGAEAKNGNPSEKAAEFIYQLCGKTYSRSSMLTNDRLAGPV
jgi:lipid-A-disaccharide synthase